MYNSIQKEIKEVAKLVNERLEKLLSNTAIININKKYSSKLLDAMRYMVLSPGKRLRPFLIYASCKLYNLEDSKNWLNVAVAFELLHTYSLIHDDLPCMDNDAERRGNPTCHIKYGEMIAVLAGDALLTYAFEILSSNNQNHLNKNIRNDLVNSLAKTTGYNGMVGGQALDIMHKDNKNIPQDYVINIMRMKTGCLFSASAEVGGIIAEKSVQEKEALRSFGQNLGIAYQIKDDLDDNDQCNHLNISHLDLYINKAVESLSLFDKNADTLRLFAKQLQL